MCSIAAAASHNRLGFWGSTFSFTCAAFTFSFIPSTTQGGESVTIIYEDTTRVAVSAIASYNSSFEPPQGQTWLPRFSRPRDALALVYSLSKGNLQMPTHDQGLRAIEGVGINKQRAALAEALACTYISGETAEESFQLLAAKPGEGSEVAVEFEDVGKLYCGARSGGQGHGAKHIIISAYTRAGVLMRHGKAVAASLVALEGYETRDYAKERIQSCLNHVFSNLAVRVPTILSRYGPGRGDGILQGERWQEYSVGATALFQRGQQDMYEIARAATRLAREGVFVRCNTSGNTDSSVTVTMSPATLKTVRDRLESYSVYGIEDAEQAHVARMRARQIAAGIPAGALPQVDVAGGDEDEDEDEDESEDDAAVPEAMEQEGAGADGNE
jgi:hypothetical protein